MQFDQLFQVRGFGLVRQGNEPFHGPRGGGIIAAVSVETRQLAEREDSGVTTTASQVFQQLQRRAGVALAGEQTGGDADFARIAGFLQVRDQFALAAGCSGKLAREAGGGVQRVGGIGPAAARV